MTESDAQLHDDILLSLVDGIGSRTYQRLIERFGSSTAILDAARSDFAGMEFHKPETLSRLLTARKDFDAGAVVDLCRREGIDILSIREKTYPEALRTIHDPPPILYVRGEIVPRDAFSLAVIGTRRMTTYGHRQTDRLTGALARAGLTIISGLARGIDAVAHRAALKAGGRTLAVLGSGHNRLYPPEHDELAREIAESGAVLSEYPPLQSSAKWTFPQRNRIVSGLSLGVLVIEAPVRSGAMISARLAGEQGRDIFAVPGSIESDASRGCHRLIRDGAYLVDSIDDILETLGPLAQAVPISDRSEPLRHPNELSLNEIERQVLRAVATGETTIETILETTGLERHQVLAALGVLEEKRIVRRLSSESFVRI